MRFCDDHWGRLRAAIEGRGLGHLIAQGGERAALNFSRELAAGKQTIATFDPLMGAHWSIVSNAMKTVERAGGNPLYLMGDGPEDEVEIPGGEGKTWPRCPLCYLGLAHELTCREPQCKLPHVDGYAWMIDRAADDQVAAWRELKEEESE